MVNTFGGEIKGALSPSFPVHHPLHFGSDLTFSFLPSAPVTRSGRVKILMCILPLRTTTAVVTVATYLCTYVRLDFREWIKPRACTLEWAELLLSLLLSPVSSEDDKSNRMKGTSRRGRTLLTLLLLIYCRSRRKVCGINAVDEGNFLCKKMELLMYCNFLHLIFTTLGIP